LTAAGIERARTEERSLVRGWLMRGTVHLVAADDYRWMLPLFAEGIVRQSRRRLARLGFDGPAQDRALAIVGRALAAEGRLSRNAIAERLEDGGLSLTPETRVHLMRVVVSEGIACIGPDEAGQGTLALSEDWLGGGGVDERDRALAELTRRYFGAFAPASDRDFAKWAGLSIRDCRVGLELIAGELDEAADGLLALRGATLRAPRSPLVRLLPAFDTYLLGYERRGYAVDRAGERRILPGGGVLKPTVCVDGRLVGLWSSKRSGRRLDVWIEPFDELPAGSARALEAEVADLGRFEGVAPRLMT
jgi:hypothetical protein